MRLKYTDMPHFIQFIADSHARSSGKGTQEILSSLEPAKTALFFGVNQQPTCSVRKKEQYHRQVRRTLRKLLKNGIHTIIVETSTLFGYYALNELTRQRGNHHFSLLAVQVEGNPYHWMHTDKKLLSERAPRNLHNFLFCDLVISPLNQNDWLNLLGRHVCLAFTEKPYCIRNMGVLSLREFNKWGPPLNEKNAQEILRWMLREDEEETIEDQFPYIRF